MLQVDSGLFYDQKLAEQVSKVLLKTKARVTMFNQLNVCVETHPTVEAWFVSIKTEDNQRDWLEEFLRLGVKDIRAFALLLDGDAEAYAIHLACKPFKRAKHPDYPLTLALV